MAHGWTQQSRCPKTTGCSAARQKDVKSDVTTQAADGKFSPAKNTVKPKGTQKMDVDYTSKNAFSAFWGMEEIDECNELTCKPCGGSCSRFHRP